MALSVQEPVGSPLLPPPLLLGVPADRLNPGTEGEARERRGRREDTNGDTAEEGEAVAQVVAQATSSRRRGEEGPPGSGRSPDNPCQDRWGEEGRERRSSWRQVPASG